MKRVLIAGDPPSSSSGLAYLALNLARYLIHRGDCQVGYLNLGHAAFNPEEAMNVHLELPWLLETSLALKHYHAPFLQREHLGLVVRAIESFQPDIVLAVHDPWLLSSLSTLRQITQSYAFGIYQTVEVPHYPESVITRGFYAKDGNIKEERVVSLRDVWNSADIIIPVTHTARRSIEEYVETVSEHIYPGVDTIHPDELRKSKREVFGVPDDALVFMSMGINRPRKALDRVIYAFAEATSGMDNVYLYMHTDPVFDGGYDLINLAKECSCNSKVLFDRNYTQRTGVQRRLLMERYLNADVYIGLPGGEGFGYGFVEALVYGKPLIYSSYGAHVELCDGKGIPVDPVTYTTAANSAIKWGVADIHQAASAIQQLVRDESLRASFTKPYRSFDLQWEEQGARIVATFLDAVGNMEHRKVVFQQKEKTTYREALRRVI